MGAEAADNERVTTPQQMVVASHNGHRRFVNNWNNVFFMKTDAKGASVQISHSQLMVRCILNECARELESDTGSSDV